MSTKRLVCGAGACLAAAAVGSSSLATPPTLELVITRDVSGSAVPGCPGEVIASSGPVQIENPSIDSNGNVIVRAYLDTSGAFGNMATTVDRAIVLYGGPPSSSNPMHLIARDGTGSWPHLPNVNNWVTQPVGFIKGLSALPSVTPGGTLFVSAGMNGAGATSANNSGFWTGVDGSVAQVAQLGFLPGPNGNAPGTNGALLSGQQVGPFSVLSLNLDTFNNHCNDAGQVVFYSKLRDGDVTPGIDDDAVFLGSPSGMALMARRGMTGMSGIHDPDAKMGASPQYGLYLNHQGEVAYIAPLEEGTGNGVSAGDKWCIWTSLGGTFRAIAREGDPTPWDSSLTFGPDGRGSGFIPFAQLGQPMSGNRSYYTVITLGGAAITGINDQVLAKYHWDAATSTGTWTPILRAGDACPLVAHAVWAGYGVNFNNTHCSSNDGLTIAVKLNDDGSGLSGIIHPADPLNPTTSNDDALVYRSPAGQLRLVAREGALLTDFGSPANLPGLPADARFSELSNNLFSGGSPHGNARGQMVFFETITGTGINAPSADHPADFNDHCLFAWDPNDGLILLGQTATTSLTFNGAPGTAIGFDVIAGATGEGTGLSLSNSGWVAFRARDAFGNHSIYRTLLGHCGSADFNHDGDVGTDADIEAFFACLSGNCCAACEGADFNYDGDVGTDADIEAFFRVLGGGGC
jgi:hypothetical protein